MDKGQYSLLHTGAGKEQSNMRKKMAVFMMCMALAFSFTACTDSKEGTDGGTSAEDPKTAVSEDQKDDTDASEDGQGTEEVTDSSGESSEPATGGFEGLEVQDEMEIELEEGQTAAGG